MASKNEIEEVKDQSGEMVNSATSHSLLGTKLGKYKIIEFIAQGGMGEVYKAIDEGTGQIVACKLLLPTLLDAQSSLERFTREVKTLQKISSVHSVKVLDSGQARERPYMILEFIEGKSLSKVIAESPNKHLLPQRGIPIFIQICSVLEEAHALRIIHRDLKPSNIMLINKGNNDDVVKVLDFGVAKVLDLTTNFRQATKTGEYVGSLPYSSPEQFTAQQIDARSDIYAFGCLMFEATMGFLPFSSDNSAGYLYKHTMQRPPSIVLFLKHPLAPALELIIHKCLAKDPNDRYQTIAELKKDLENINSKKISKRIAIFQFIGKASTVFSSYLNKVKRTLFSQRISILGLALFAVAAICLLYPLYGPGQDPSAAERQLQLKPVLSRRGPVYDSSGEPMNKLAMNLVSSPDTAETAVKYYLELGNDFKDAGNYSQAIVKYDLARELIIKYKALDETALCAEVCLAQAECYLQSKSDEERIKGFCDYASARLAKLGMMKSRNGLMASAFLGQAYVNLGEREKARIAFDEYWHLFGQVWKQCSSADLVLTLSYAADFYRQMGMWEQARHLYLLAIANYQPLIQFDDASYNIGVLQSRISRVLLAERSFELAEEFWQKAQKSISDGAGSIIDSSKLEYDLSDIKLAQWKLVDYIQTRAMARKLWDNWRYGYQTQTQTQTQTVQQAQ